MHKVHFKVFEVRGCTIRVSVFGMSVLNWEVRKLLNLNNNDDDDDDNNNTTNNKNNRCFTFHFRHVFAPVRSLTVTGNVTSSVVYKTHLSFSHVIRRRIETICLLNSLPQ